MKIRYVWAVLDPKNEIRSLYLKKPGRSAAAWVWVGDSPNHSGNTVYSPTDNDEAKRRGYKVKRMKLIL